MSENKYKSCRDCKFAECNQITTNLNDNYSNWICKHDGKRMIIGLSKRDSESLKPPIWCPYGSMISLGKTNKMETNNEQKEHKLTFLEKRDRLDRLKPLIEWNDIKINEVYHCPPLLYETRKDILVLSKNDLSLTYKVLSTNPKKSSSSVQTLYKTMLISKFLTKHKVQKIELINSN